MDIGLNGEHGVQEPITFQGFWHGPPLTTLLWSALSSFIRNGHAFHLYCYSPVPVPDGVVIRDAREVLPPEDIFFFKNPQMSKPDIGPFSDLFRFKLLLEKGGWYVDVDTFCLSNQIPNFRKAWAGESPETSPLAIGPGQIAFPAGDEIVAMLYERCRTRAREFARREELGPNLISQVINELRLPRDLNGEPDTFYPIRWVEMFKLWLPEFAKEVGARTEKAYFLPFYMSWSSYIGVAEPLLPPKNSFLWRLCQKYAPERCNADTIADGRVKDLIRTWLIRKPSAQAALRQVEAVRALAHTGRFTFEAAHLPASGGEFVNGAWRADGNARSRGNMTYGPYIPLGAGHYRFEIAYSASADAANAGSWDVYTNAQEGITLKQGLLSVTGGKTNVACGEFEVPPALSGEKFEIRTFFDGSGLLEIHSLQIAVQDVRPKSHLSRTTNSLADGARVHIVCYEDLDSWILGKMAVRLRDNLISSGIKSDISKTPDSNAQINHHICYFDYNGLRTTTDTIMITHIDTETELEKARFQLGVTGAEMGVCMSLGTMSSLLEKGIAASKLCVIHPAHDGNIPARKIVVGIACRVYPDGRKREWLLSQLADRISPDDFWFKIIGSGWHSIVAQLRSKSFAVEYHDVFTVSVYKELISSIDYYLHPGMDEGSMGFLDALAAGVRTIVTPQGYHLDAPGGVTHAFTDFNELQQVFSEIAKAKTELQHAVAEWTWREHTRKHVALWEYLLARKANQRIPESLLSELKGINVAMEHS